MREIPIPQTYNFEKGLMECLRSGDLKSIEQVKLLAEELRKQPEFKGVFIVIEDQKNWQEIVTEKVNYAGGLVLDVCKTAEQALSTIFLAIEAGIFVDYITIDETLSESSGLEVIDALSECLSDIDEKVIGTLLSGSGGFAVDVALEKHFKEVDTVRIALKVGKTGLPDFLDNLPSVSAES